MRKIYTEKSSNICVPKAIPRPLFGFGKQPKTAITYKEILEIF